MTEKPYYYDRALDKIKNRETGDDYWFLCDIADLLNKQDKRIKELEKENRGLQFKIIDMLDFVKEKGTVTREEIKKWWNGDVE